MRIEAEEKWKIVGEDPARFEAIVLPGNGEEMTMRVHHGASSWDVRLEVGEALRFARALVAALEGGGA